jgi:hypothetical protein
MSGEQLTANLPATPLGTSKTIASGVKVEIWAAHRSAGAVTIVFALDDASGGNISTDGDGNNDTDDESNLEEALSSNPANHYGNDGVSNVGLFDTNNLTEYKTFCKVARDGTVSDCLDSADVVELQHNGARQYFAVVVAAPPASVRTATVVTGVGSVPDVPISG